MRVSRYLLWLYSVVIGGLVGCQQRAATPVRVDVARAAAALQIPLSPPVPAIALPDASRSVSESAIALAEVSPPPIAESLSQRRQAAVRSVEQQREAVYQQLLATRLRPLAALEPRWEAELRAEYDLEALRAERDAEWSAAFQAYGQRRFPILVALVFTQPNSEAHRQAQAQLATLEREWHAQEQAIDARYQAHLQRIEQEIRARLTARRREFIRTAEQEVLIQLQQQPDLTQLYLPQPQRLPPAPARKQPLPELRVQLPARDLSEPFHRRFATAEQTRYRLLSQLAHEWAQLHRYRLTTDPNAPDKTEEFIRYLRIR